MAFKNDLLVCTPLECENATEMLSSMEKAKAEGADLVELRVVDSIAFSYISQVEKLIKRRTLPAILSYRVESSRNSTDRDCKSTFLQVLRLAFDLNVEFVEVDYEVLNQNHLRTTSVHPPHLLIEISSTSWCSLSSIPAAINFSPSCTSPFSCSPLKFLSSFVLAQVASDSGNAEYLCDRPNSKLIVSSYVNGGKPSAEKLGCLIACMQSTGADVIKLVIDVDYITDLAPVFEMLAHSVVPLIALAVGSRGLISQLLGPKFGGFLVYGSLEDNAVPGMPTLSSLRQVYKLEYLNPDTKVFGLISNPVGHSKGPILHNPAFRHEGYNGIYVPMQVDDIKEFFRTYTGLDFAGFSVGIPHKEAAVGCCDEVHPLAKIVKLP